MALPIISNPKWSGIKSIALSLAFWVGAPCSAAAWVWSPDSNQSEIEFEAIGRPAMIKIHGVSKKGLSGTLVFDGKTLTGACAFDLATLDTGIKTRNDHMKEKYLQVKAFPKTELSFNPVSLPNPLENPSSRVDGVSFHGMLELHGSKKPVEGTLTLKREGDQLSTETNFTIKISDFSISKPSFAGVSMAEDVKIHVQAKGAWIEKKDLSPK